LPCHHCAEALALIRASAQYRSRAGQETLVPGHRESQPRKRQASHPHRARWVRRVGSPTRRSRSRCIPCTSLSVRTSNGIAWEWLGPPPKRTTGRRCPPDGPPNRRTSSSSGVWADRLTDAAWTLRHSRYITGTHRLTNRKTNADRRTEITTNTTTATRIHRVAAGAALAAALGLIALGTALATPAAAEDSTVALPPGGPVAIYPHDQSTGGANPYTPFGTNPYVPYGVWAP
jgi:hypothetical protein